MEKRVIDLSTISTIMRVELFDSKIFKGNYSAEFFVGEAPSGVSDAPTIEAALEAAVPRALLPRAREIFRQEASQ